MLDDRKKLEIIFSPELFKYYENPPANVVIVDILRATSAICAAFQNGVSQIIPVPSRTEAKQYKNKGYIVAAERDGQVLDFADFGNSPFNFTSERIKNKSVAYSTTNGTKAIHLARQNNKVIIASFLNISVVADLLIHDRHDVLILCAGWKGKFSLEDTVFSGALAEKLLDSGNFYSICDSVKASIDLWKLAKTNIMEYIDKVAQRERLRKLGLDDVLEYCHTPDTTDKIPVYQNGVIEAYHESSKCSDPDK